MKTHAICAALLAALIALPATAGQATPNAPLSGAYGDVRHTDADTGAFERDVRAKAALGGSLKDVASLLWTRALFGCTREGGYLAAFENGYVDGYADTHEGAIRMNAVARCLPAPDLSHEWAEGTAVTTHGPTDDGQGTYALAVRAGYAAAHATAAGVIHGTCTGKGQRVGTATLKDAAETTPDGTTIGQGVDATFTCIALNATSPLLQ